MAFPMGKKYKFTDSDVPALAPGEGTSFESMAGVPLVTYIKLLFDDGLEEGENFIFKYPVVKFIPVLPNRDLSETAIDVSGAYCYVGDTGEENELYMVYAFVETFKSEQGEMTINTTFDVGNYIFYNPTDHSDYIQAPIGAGDFDFNMVKKYAPWPMEVVSEPGGGH